MGKECKMKPVKCETCLQPIPLSQIYDHVLTVHQKNPLQANLGEDKSFKVCTPSGLLASEYRQTLLNIANSDLKFLINRKTFNKSLIMYWVSICGTQTEAEDYKYTIK